MRTLVSSILAAGALVALSAGCREASPPAPASANEVVLTVPGMT